MAVHRTCDKYLLNPQMTCAVQRDLKPCQWFLSCGLGANYLRQQRKRCNKQRLINCWWNPLGSKWIMCVCSVMSDSLRPPWTGACQAPLFLGFSRQEYWSGLPFPSPGDLPNSGTELRSPALQADSLPTELRYLWYLWVIDTYLYSGYCEPISDYIHIFV